jgi:hypothetical protein
MKKLFYLAIGILLVAGSVQYVLATGPYNQRSVNLYQPFELSLHETVQVGNYPLAIEYQSLYSVQCFAAPCPPPKAYIVFHYPYGTYTTTFTENETRNYRGAYMTVSSIDDTITVFLSAAEVPHVPGTNVKSSDGTVWFIDNAYQRRAYTSAGAFLSYGFNNFSSVVPANSADYALPTWDFIPPADGKVMCSDRGFDRGTCYLITNNEKAGFTSEAVFIGLGYKFSRAIYGDVSFLPYSGSLIDNANQQHRPGTLINRQGTVLYVNNGGYVAFPSVEVFNSWGFSFEDVVPANQADNSLISYGSVSFRQQGELRPQ